MSYFKQNRKLILASTSPRRKELLTKYGFNFKVVTPSFDEDNNSELNPKDFVMESALNKARSVTNNYTDEILLGADTIVSLNNKIIGKPTDYKTAVSYLSLLSAQTHQVYTGFVLTDLINNKECLHFVKSNVTFRKLDQKQIKSYLETGEYKDKAGAYSIQGLGQLLVKSIEGSYTNIIGLPVEEVFNQMHLNGWLKF